MAREKTRRHSLLLPRGKTRAPRRAQSIERKPRDSSIWDAVAQIPARQRFDVRRRRTRAGLPGRARQAGYALKHMPVGLHLPWHRVVGAGGRIGVRAPPPAHIAEQARRLRAEGVEVTDGRVARAALQGRLRGD